MKASGWIAALRRYVLDLLTNDSDTFGDPTGLRVHLYQNDYTPDGGVDLTALTEADFSGYAPIDLTETSWSISDDADGGHSLVHQELPIFSPDGGIVSPQDIPGYYVTHGPSTAPALLFANSFAEPISAAFPGQNIPVVVATQIIPNCAAFSPTDV